ncbi:AN1-type zinc finger protein [Planoprotostelium fungivorum]|uniref:AN1-type zinc finger protein n=1 Tax=Planoprotostelium fungivorum TaxID=1890364 RepID=A0A2P6NNG6_9EUKA|nr:AN1-type zinc finger protein [Planoprotostelium fungivorum]
MTDSLRMKLKGTASSLTRRSGAALSTTQLPTMTHMTTLIIRDVQALFCPACGKSVPIKGGDDRDQNLSVHHTEKCLSNPSSTASKEKLAASKSKKAAAAAAAKAPPPLSYKCEFPNCRQTEHIEIKCKGCQKNFCLRHRFEGDHKCPKPPPRAAAAKDKCIIS